MSRFIASGAYGCIYHPPYDCKGADLKDKTLLSKLVKNDFTSKTEFEIPKLLKNEKGFLVMKKKCNITSTAIKKMEKGCELLDKDPKIEKEYILMYSTFINGIELVDYIKKDFTINKLMKTFFFLCNQIEIMINHKIIHHDLHFGNILYNYNTKKLVIIDFGLSINSSQFYLNNNLNYPYLKEAIFKYTPSWKYFSLEEHLLSYLIHEGSIDEDVIKETLKIYLDNHTICNVPNFCAKYIETSINYFKKYVKKPKEYVIRKFLSYWNTWDYYKISLHILKIYYKLKIHYDELLMLLLLMIHPIPKYRPSVIDVNKNLQILLNIYSNKIDYEGIVDKPLSVELTKTLKTLKTLNTLKTQSS